MSFNVNFDPKVTTPGISGTPRSKMPSTASAQSFEQQLEVMSKAASEATSSSAKAMINMQNTPVVHSCVLWKTGPEYDYMRQRILDRAGIFPDESPRQMTNIIKADKSTPSKFDSIKKLGIENLTTTGDGKGVRGACQLSNKMKKNLPELQKGGIKRIIDLRQEGSHAKSQALCERNGMQYFSFPVAYEQHWDKETIEKIPDLIQEMKKGDYYIGCAYGLHRTDTAIALSYFFDPHATTAPKIESGFTKDKMLQIRGNIFRALNDICYTDKAKTQFRLDDAFAQKLGWKNLAELMEQIPIRKQAISAINNLV